jgi:hypothetical protein
MENPTPRMMAWMDEESSSDSDSGGSEVENEEIVCVRMVQVNDRRKRRRERERVSRSAIRRLARVEEKRMAKHRKKMSMVLSRNVVEMDIFTWWVGEAKKHEDVDTDGLEAVTKAFPDQLHQYTHSVMHKVSFPAASQEWCLVAAHADIYGRELFNAWRNTLCENEPDLGEVNPYQYYQASVTIVVGEEEDYSFGPGGKVLGKAGMASGFNQPEGAENPFQVV